MDKAYPILYNQQNYPDKLGTSPTATIASDGCFVTSFAMKAGYYGHTISPTDLNKLFTDFNGHPIYIQNDLLPDNALAQVYSDIKYVKTLDYEPIPTDLQTIQGLLADPATTITIRINRGGGNLHFVEAVGCDGHTLHIANPWSGRVEDFTQDYGSPVTANLHVIVYTGTPTTIKPTVPDPAITPLAQTFNRAITKSSNFDTVADFLGITQDQRVTTSAGIIVVERIKQLQSDLKAAQDSLTELKKIPEVPVATPPSDATVTATTTTVTPPSVPAPVVQPTFSNGAPAVSSSLPDQVAINRMPNFQPQKLSPLQKVWKTLVFWLG